MSSVLSLCALLLFCLVTVSDCDKKRNKICYQAKTCIHNMNGRCGVDSSGDPRRFIDSCDLLEYNCLKGTDFQKAPAEKCKHLPPIEDDAEKKSKLNIDVNSKEQEHKEKGEADVVKLKEEEEAGVVKLKEGVEADVVKLKEEEEAGVVKLKEEVEADVVKLKEDIKAEEE